MSDNRTESLLLQRTRPRPIPAEYDRPAEGIPPGPILGGAQRMKVTDVENDYLVCDLLDGNGDVIATDVKVAKPPELRHDKDWYEGLTDLTTTNAQEVEATDGIDTEDWIVKPPYIVDTTEIAAMTVAAAFGLEVDSKKLTLVDINVAGRVWGLDV